MTKWVRWFRRGIPAYRILPAAFYALLALPALHGMMRFAEVFVGSFTSSVPEHILYAIASESKELLPLLAAITGLLLMIAWGALRAVLFHPLAVSSYRKWLRTTPWQPGKPLPLGPLGVTTQDCAALVAVSIVVLLYTPMPIYVVPMAFLTAYCVTALPLLVMGGEKRYAYVLAFGLGVPLGLLAWPWASFVALVVLYGFAHRGLEHSLYRFPWEPNEEAFVLGAASQLPTRDLGVSLPTWRGGTRGNPKLAHLSTDLGWPLRILRYRWPKPVFSRIDAILVALLPGFLIAMGAIALWIARPAELDIDADWLSALAGILFVYASLARVVVYLGGCGPPLSIFGRICTGRILIPGYDVVFVSPLAALAAGFGGMNWMAGRGFHEVPAAICGITAFMLILLNGGPSLSKWRLTGDYRSAPRFLTTTSGFVKL